MFFSHSLCRRRKGEIILKIVPAINRKVAEKTVPTGIPSAPTQIIPIIETRQTSTIIKARDGQTIIISGLIREEDVERSKKVPLFGDIPIFGILFKHKSKIKQRSELIILLTPHLKSVNFKDLDYKHLGLCIKNSII